MRLLKRGETVDDVANTFHVSSRRIELLVKILKDHREISDPKTRKTTESVPLVFQSNSSGEKTMK